MATWPEVELGEVCEFKYGKSLAAGNRDGGPFPVYGSNGAVGGHSVAITNGPTIIIGRKGSFGEVAYSQSPCWPIDTTYYVDVSATKADLKWLSHRLKALGLTRLNRAAAIPGLNREDAYRQRLLLPPLDEQRRIAAILDHADGLRAMRRRTLAELDRLTDAIFVDVFGDGIDESSGVPHVPLTTLVETVTYGFTNPMTHVTSGIPIVTAKSIRDRRIDLTGGKFTNQRDFQALTGKSRPKRGDVLVTKDGTIGRCAVVSGDSLFCINQSVALVRPRFELVRPEYLVGYLSLHRVQRQMNGMGKGNALKHLQITELAKMLIPHPDIEAQDLYAQRKGKADVLRATAKRALSGTDEFFASLQGRAFRGEL